MIAEIDNFLIRNIQRDIPERHSEYVGRLSSCRNDMTIEVIDGLDEGGEVDN